MHMLTFRKHCRARILFIGICTEYFMHRTDQYLAREESAMDKHVLRIYRVSDMGLKNMNGSYRSTITETNTNPEDHPIVMIYPGK